MSDQCCETCRFYRDCSCCRFPPIGSRDYTPPYQGAPSTTPTWPFVRNYDWCGEWKGKPAAEETDKSNPATGASMAQPEDTT